MIVETNARGFSRLEQSSRARLFDLSELRNNLQTPQPAAVGRGNQIASMHVPIANRSCGQINLQSLPMISAIERYIDALLCAAVKQSLALTIFAHDARDGVVRQTVDYFLPGLTGITRAKNIWVQIGRHG